MKFCSIRKQKSEAAIQLPVHAATHLFDYGASTQTPEILALGITWTR